MSLDVRMSTSCARTPPRTYHSHVCKQPMGLHLYNRCLLSQPCVAYVCVQTSTSVGFDPSSAQPSTRKPDAMLWRGNTHHLPGRCRWGGVKLSLRSSPLESIYLATPECISPMISSSGPWTQFVSAHRTVPVREVITRKKQAGRFKYGRHAGPYIPRQCGPWLQDDAHLSPIAGHSKVCSSSRSALYPTIPANHPLGQGPGGGSDPPPPHWG
jgi:hypothetical protein